MFSGPWRGLPCCVSLRATGEPEGMAKLHLNAIYFFSVLMFFSLPLKNLFSRLTPLFGLLQNSQAENRGFAFRETICFLGIILRNSVIIHVFQESCP